MVLNNRYNRWINTPSPTAQAIVSKGFVFVSGTVGHDHNLKLCEGGIKVETVRFSLSLAWVCVKVIYSARCPREYQESSQGRWYNFGGHCQSWHIHNKFWGFWGVEWDISGGKSRGSMGTETSTLRIVLQPGGYASADVCAGSRTASKGSCRNRVYCSLAITTWQHKNNCEVLQSYLSGWYYSQIDRSFGRFNNQLMHHDRCTSKWSRPKRWVDRIISFQLSDSVTSALLMKGTGRRKAIYITYVA